MSNRWYIIHAYSGFENKVRDAIVTEAARKGLDAFIESVEVPVEKVTEVRRGKKVTSDRKFFPGYVLAKMAMNDDIYHLVKNTPKVTGFLGQQNKPQPISEAEAARILNTKAEEAVSTAKVKHKVNYEIGDQVKVLDGPFAVVQRPRRGARFRPRPGQGLGVDLRPRDAGRTGLRPGREAEVAQEFYADCGRRGSPAAWTTFRRAPSWPRRLPVTSSCR